MQRLKYILIGLLALLVVVFIIQNTEQVTVSFITLDFVMPRAFLLGLVFFFGILLGMIIPRTKKKQD